jgi:CBS domain containing-hemolysin-like protein
MLTEPQIADVWEGQVSAEVRSLYFGDLANVYSRRKQWITGLSFFLSLGAAATLITKLPEWIPIALSVIVALITAYAVAVNLDSKIRTMAKLHYAWKLIGNDYKRLWSHTYSDDAESELAEIQRREMEISELATTDAPNDTKRMLRWTDQVYKQRRLEAA